uniref:Uncharacterized protein n=1 Tax=Rhizophagus irregularis (strain DAOM 181602 / DAOM 197198 / MUCL 43194) TaxID=747089 RepID=U9US06_RHIID
MENRKGVTPVTFCGDTEEDYSNTFLPPRDHSKNICHPPRFPFFISILGTWIFFESRGGRKVTVILG